MGNVAEHLKNLEESNAALAETFERFGKLYERVSEIIAKSDLEEASELASAFRDIANAQRKAASLNIAIGAYNSQIRSDLALMANRQPHVNFGLIAEDGKPITSKAASDELQKTDVQVVIPAPPTAAERIYGNDGLIAIRRPGQPDLKPAKVSPEFEGLVKVEDE